MLAGRSDVADLADDALELLARHHALPSPLIDFTRSPFIAAYYAIADARPPTRCTVWQLDLAGLPDPPPEVTVVDDPMLIRFNPRALRQRGVFLRIGTASAPVEQLADSAISRYDLPTTAREQALAELDEMGINAAALFADLDAVARTAAGRIVLP